MFGPGVTVGQK